MAGTGLTYGQLDEYIDRCTKVVDQLAGWVLRTAYAFDRLPDVSLHYVDEYIEALVIGLNRKKRVKEEQRATNLRRMQELLQDRGPEPHE